VYETRPNFLTLLKTLAAHHVDFIVVGGVSGVMQGAPLSTYDVDIVHARDPDNLDRLVPALREMNAYYREHPNRRPRPEAKLLAGPGHHLLATDHGSLDLLGEIVGGRVYDDLVPHTVELPMDSERRIRVLSLPTLLLLKEELGREKDRAVIAILKRTIEESGGST